MLLQEQGLDYLQNSGFAFLAMNNQGVTFQGEQAE
jgi:hypothetical protein